MVLTTMCRDRDAGWRGGRRPVPGRRLDRGHLRPGREERYRPLRLEDNRMPLHVFGRVPPGIAEVEVELGGGTATGRGPVLQGGQAGGGDGFYVVELDREPVAVVGLRADGSTLRYEIPE